MQFVIPFGNFNNRAFFGINELLDQLFDLLRTGLG